MNDTPVFPLRCIRCWQDRLRERRNKLKRRRMPGRQPDCWTGRAAHATKVVPGFQKIRSLAQNHNRPSLINPDRVRNLCADVSHWFPSCWACPDLVALIGTGSAISFHAGNFFSREIVAKGEHTRSHQKTKNK